MPTYISSQGLEDMKKEWENRKMKIRKEIASKIEAAKELGDLSENFEYHEAKEQQALNETRIAQLDDMLKDYVVIEEKRGGLFISLGCTFIVEYNGKQKTFEIVGSNEANPLEGKISNESPLGQAFLGHAVGTFVEVTVPFGVMQYKIIEIK
ncbi:MAG: Transcription elongation factor GreA [Candidatus Uhrbacteria bacterium GW2011_GWF2_41_16]|jgi:transcription elongation factor GreA|uniref:Transcription elongation factor GreA n=2 Tax=Candidatus Uhriibacteriota TaxID=1752732 RepID=A0A0G0XK18_9BACT|nr:MAG: Transcription elongation factor GreA [Candidatus Uhrbacteria bacterium GW2011_GWA2_41_10]KKR86051.1 MAG: Transcription elongation factor GreA [Candidatus Uhrbacteria bacterium GW2011_GWC2_41_11]KKR97105.1 MAG: Transcription elongation factor GreA [Candidatus Uhrbacteria bacterium GW2011_GWF2_41_16]HBP00312.1 transcription elongation factor GreA [Candidatus Uhrbacteria bacterium]